MFDVHHFPGYGGPEQWALRVTYANRLLSERLYFNERSLGLGEGAARHRWSKKSKAELAGIAARKKLASDWCYHCGRDTIGWVSSLADWHFCRECSPLVVEAYRATLEKP